ncbi:MAG: hypothetical protein FWD97_07730 [Defluviitaleaceae bacterium]|nr:hypothetical protein [Defluviitaleaceae bacterium]
MTFVLAVALSFDALGMGVSCGLRRHRLGLRTYLIVFAVSVFVLGVAEFLGGIFADVLPEGTATIAAAVWVTSLGLWILINSFRCKGEYAPILSEWQLALMLSLDSLGVGLATASLGFDVFLLPLLAAGFQVFFLMAGYYLSGIFKKLGHRQRMWTVLSGLILIAMGLSRIL